MQPRRARSRRPPARCRPVAARPRPVDPTRDRRAAARRRTTRAQRASVPPWPCSSGRTRARRTAEAPERPPTRSRPPDGRPRASPSPCGRARRAHRRGYCPRAPRVALAYSLSRGSPAPRPRLDQPSTARPAIAWYRDTLGLEQRNEPTEVEPVFMGPFGACIALFQSEVDSPPRAPESSGVRHVAFALSAAGLENARSHPERPGASRSDRRTTGAASRSTSPTPTGTDRADDVRALRRRGVPPAGDADGSLAWPDGRDRGGGAGQGLPLADARGPRARRRRPGGAGGHRARPPRPERRREDHDRPDPRDPPAEGGRRSCERRRPRRRATHERCAS